MPLAPSVFCSNPVPPLTKHLSSAEIQRGLYSATDFPGGTRGTNAHRFAAFSTDAAEADVPAASSIAREAREDPMRGIDPDPLRKRTPAAYDCSAR